MLNIFCARGFIHAQPVFVAFHFVKCADDVQEENMDNAKNFPLSQPSNRRRWITHAANVAAAFSVASRNTWARAAEDLSRNAEAIHQEVTFKATRKRVFEALTNAQQFQKLESFSSAMNGVDIQSKPAVIDPQPGGAFSLFGEYVTGRQIELVQDRRIVQAWRAASWDPGIYSIAHFELLQAGMGTKLVFDHVGFPAGTGEHLAAGWKANYWEPLEKLLV
jgi:activator of HSP90 ATPase